MTDHAEAAWYPLELLGDVLTQMAQATAAARTGVGLRLIYVLIARQVLRQRLARWLVARRLVHRRALALGLAFGGLQVLQLQFQLFDLVVQLLGFAAELHAPQLGDHQLQVLDLDFGRGQLGTQPGYQLVVRQVRTGWRQSMPSSSIDSCACVSMTVPLAACGQMKRPRSSRLASRHRPSPVHHSSLMMSPRRPRNTKTWPLNGSACSAVSTLAARPLKPQRMSVTPAAIQIRVWAGRPIMAEAAATPGPAWPRRRRPPAATALCRPSGR